MDKVYTFDWLLNSIDSSVVFMLYDGNNQVTGYEASSVLSGDMSAMEVKFANIDDLNKFINYGIVRFTDVNDRNNIIDIPVRNLYLFYKNSNSLEEVKRKRVKLADLDSFAVMDGEVMNGEYAIEIVCIAPISEELNKLMQIMSDYSGMSMNEKFDALGDVNLINYRMDKQEEYA